MNKETFIENNYQEYLKKGLKIGFTKPFPENSSDIKDQLMVDLTKEGSPIKFEIRFGNLTFGEKNEYNVLGITTDRLEIPRTGLLGGFGQHGYIDEAKLMNMGMYHMLKKHGLMICEHVCSWPFVKVVVTKVTDAHLGIRPSQEEIDKKLTQEKLHYYNNKKLNLKTNNYGHN